MNFENNKLKKDNSLVVDKEETSFVNIQCKIEQAIKQDSKSFYNIPEQVNFTNESSYNLIQQTKLNKDEKIKEDEYKINFSIASTILKTISKERENELILKIEVLNYLCDLFEELSIISSKTKKEEILRIIKTIPKGTFRILDAEIFPLENLFILVKALQVTIQYKLSKKDKILGNIEKFREIGDQAESFLDKL